jgi:hypothetical protein
MTPKQQRLNNLKKSQLITKTRRYGFGLFYISMVIISISLILGALNG